MEIKLVTASNSLFDFYTGGAPTLDKGAFPCKDPEKTRKALEQWVPRDDWGDVNWLLVGLGQEVQTEKPKLRCKGADGVGSGIRGRLSPGGSG